MGWNQWKHCQFGAGRMITPSAACLSSGAGAGAIPGGVTVLRTAASSRASADKARQRKASVVLTSLLLLIFRSKGFSSQIKRCFLLPPAKSAASPGTSPVRLWPWSASRLEWHRVGRSLRMIWATSVSLPGVLLWGSGQWCQHLSSKCWEPGSWWCSYSLGL